MEEKEPKEIVNDEHPQDEPNKTEKTEEEKRADRIGWLRFILIHVAVLIPLVVGLACLIGGTNHDNKTMALVGALFLEVGVPSVMAILVAALLIWKYRGVKKLKQDTTVSADDTTVADEAQADEPTLTDEEKEETPSQSERERNAINAVNSTRRGASRANMAAYEMDSIAEGMRHAPKWGLPVGLTCFFSLFALLIVATVLLIKRLFVGAIVCAAIVGVVLITTLIVMVVSRAKATNGDIRKAKKITEGKVKACFMIGTATTKSAGTVRIQGVTYRVIVIADGVEYGAFSNQFYETDETVTVAVMSKRRAKIVEKESVEPEETDDE